MIEANANMEIDAGFRDWYDACVVNIVRGEREFFEGGAIILSRLGGSDYGV